MTSASRYAKLFEDAERSVDYWAEVTITEFTEDICRLMEKKGVGRSELARRLDCSPAYITKALAGSNFQLSTMVRFAMALDSVVHLHVAPKNAVVKWNDVPIETAREYATDDFAKKVGESIDLLKQRPASTRIWNVESGKVDLSNRELPGNTEPLILFSLLDRSASGASTSFDATGTASRGPAGADPGPSLLDLTFANADRLERV